MTFSDFHSIYDFTVIEKAVQQMFANIAFFSVPPCDGDPAQPSWTPPANTTAFYTAFQALVFQKCRPRVYIASFDFQTVRQAYAIDANNNLREKAWTGSIRLGVITEPDYRKHTELRAKVLSIVPMIMPGVTFNNSELTGTGINQFLFQHQITEFYVDNLSTQVIPDEGTYRSTINIKTAFSVLPSAWPPGMINE